MAAAGASLTVGACSGIQPYEAPEPTGPFRHGIASGDPDQNSVMLWTALTDDGGGYRGVEVARDEAFADIVFSQGQDIRYIQPQALGTLKILATGLEPGQTYFYRFVHNETRSQTGRTCTLPTGSVAQYSIGVFSCANFPAGHFNVYRNAAESEPLDLVLHLGDYLYEYGMGEYATGDSEQLNRMPVPAHEILNRDDYIQRHAQYKSDPDLQALHAAAPWVIIWDDHETANNTWALGAENHNEGEGDWIERRDLALRVWYDWTPTREGAVLHERWHALEVGDLATIVMMESRLAARTERPTWDDCPVPPGADMNEENMQLVQDWLRDHVGRPESDVLGSVQQDFITDTCAASVEAGKPWRLLGNQVIMGKVQSPNFDQTLPFWVKWIAESRGAAEFVDRSRFDIPFNFDFWNGYPAARERLYAALKAVGADFITLTGDSHSFWVNDLKDQAGDRVGVEFGGSSVTSPSPFAGAPGIDAGAIFEAANPDTVRLNAYDNGWMRVTLTPTQAEVDFVSIDRIDRRSTQSDVKDRWRVRPAQGGIINRVERIT